MLQISDCIGDSIATLYQTIIDRLVQGFNRISNTIISFIPHSAIWRLCVTSSLRMHAKVWRKRIWRSLPRLWTWFLLPRVMHVLDKNQATLSRIPGKATASRKSSYHDHRTMNHCMTAYNQVNGRTWHNIKLILISASKIWSNFLSSVEMTL
jgi:hypothetical protein